LADYQSDDNRRLTIGHLSADYQYKSYKNLTSLPFEIEKKLFIVISALRIAVKPALDDHQFVKLSGCSKQVVAQ